MIVIKLMGGLGNQLQQYSLYRRMIENGIEAKLDTSWFDAKNQNGMLAPRDIEINRFKGINYEVASYEDIRTLTGGNSLLGKLKRHLGAGFSHYLNESGRIYIDEIANGIFETGTIKDMYLEGYFACEIYHEKILPILRRELEFPLEEHTDKDRLIKIADDIKNNDSVSIHIRRGDYLNNANSGMFGGICTDDYYDAAVRRVLELKSRPKFYIFSDDTQFAAEFNHDLTRKYDNVTYDIVEINKGSDSFFDILLMSLCTANITANSTFSYWGARLNSHVDKLMIRPTIHINSHTFDEERMKVWWKGWEFVSPDGKAYK